jgi:predicted dinucleotide-binding enzyme
MKVAVLGTGMVGATIATKLIECAHEMTMGARTGNNEKAAAWARSAKGNARAATFRDAALASTVVFNCTRGDASLEALNAAGKDALNGKLLIDVANPLHIAPGVPPSLTVCNTDSLGEQIQRAFPAVKVVKALNTLTAPLMVNPRALRNDHVLPMCGNDAAAKSVAAGILKQFGWKDAELLDLSPIQSSRGMEAWLLMWVQLWGKLGTHMFNVQLVRAVA